MPRFTGGTVTYDGAYRVHTFTTSGTLTVVDGGLCDVLVVAGGGGGGGEGSAFVYYGAGGGAGEHSATSATTITSNVTVTVGGGGAGGTDADGTNGTNSSCSGGFADTATGGGGGAGGAVSRAGKTGGSGGGGTFSAGAGGVGSAGNDGGVGSTGGSANGGGGGAGAVGGAGVSATGGAGGAGTASSITGTSVTRAGGGGGTGGTTPGAGGTGGGGGASNSATGTAGTANTGGGGGGAGNAHIGGAGGSGVVIFRYLAPGPPGVSAPCVGWWDAADPATITVTGAGVSTWADKSASINNATQTTDASRPPSGTRTINGLNVLDFDGTADHLILPNLMSGLAAGTAIFVACKDVDPPVAGADGPLLGDWGSEATITHFPFTDGVIYDTFGTTARKTTVDPGVMTIPFVYSVHSGSADWKSFWNGAQIFSTGTNTVGWATAPFIGKSSLGGAAWYDGRLGEIVVYATKLSDADRKSVEAYLTNKWLRRRVTRTPGQAVKRSSVF